MPNQEQLINVAEELLLGDGSELAEQWKSALSKPYQKANGELADYSTLKGQLNNYTQKNNFDYFIHKDLGGFLTRELDFYIKNELMQWEDLAALKNNPARLAPMLSKLDVIRDLGGKIITFLAQLENFQKKLWLKKKFVTETNYCITLDRVPEELYPEICNNQAQLEEWIKLFAIDEIKGDLTSPAFSNPLTPEFLQANQNLVLDTQFFSEQFKAELVASIEDFDAQCDGLLVHSENFQALQLLQERYREKVECVYVDPPYNTGGDGFCYKDGYRHSSWLSLLSQINVASLPLLSKYALLYSHIDDNEQEKYKSLLVDIYGEKNFQSQIAWKNKYGPGAMTKGFGSLHEHILVFSKNEIDSIEAELSDEEQAKYNQTDEKFSVRGGFVTQPLATKSKDDRPNLVYPISFEGTEIWPDKQWIWSKERMEAALANDDIVIRDNKGKFSVRFKQYLKDSNGKMRKGKPLSLLLGPYNQDGSFSIEKLFGARIFAFPKPYQLPKKLLNIAVNGKDLIDCYFLDYFAGSGTTAHAVINLNREDKGKRKYILMEMGDHFDTVLKPRLAKVAYASEWKNGKPVARDTGISHCFKYIRLESYEDTLGNLTLNTKQDLFSQASNDDARQAYVMNYMLDVETRGSQSLLNIEQFLDPTQYQLNVRSASGDETVPVKVDLLETFNYLLGLEVEHIAAPMHFDAEIITGEYGRKQAKVKHTAEGKWWFRTVYGKNRNGQYVLVVWRNLPSVIEAGSDAAKRTEALIADNAVLDAVLVERLNIRSTKNPDDEIDILYVNGDNNIATPRDRKGNPMEQVRVRLIEESFKRLMFADTEAVH